MQPSQVGTPVPTAATGFKPKYRQFHPMDRVWVKNPFEHDIIFQVADEYNRPFRYRIPARNANGELGCVSELPGGAIATLGVKHIVDEMIQNASIGNEQHAALQWDERTRAKYEEKIIVDVKSTKLSTDADRPGEVNLASNNLPAATQAPAAAPEVPEVNAFDDLNPVTPAPVLPDLPPEASQGIADVVAASLPAANAEVGANNTHANAEG